MPRLIKANQATASKRRCYFDLRSDTDGLTPDTGQADGQPQISSNGSAWSDTGIGALVAVGQGRYYAELTQAAVATAGTIVETRYKGTGTVETPGDTFHVVAFDPDDAAALGLTRLDAAVTTRATAQQVWEYGTRALTSYGTLVADTATAVWAATARTLTSITDLTGALVTAIWAGAARTLTSFGTLAADIDIQLSGTHGAGTWEDTGGGAGSGSNSVTITVKDDANAPVAGARLTIKNQTETVTLAVNTTSGNGVAVFNLDNGTYKALVTSTPAYVPLTAQGLIVTGTTTATYTLTRVSETEPVAPSTCVVYGTLVRVTGAPAAGVQLVFSLPSTKGAEGGTTEIIGVALSETVTTNSSGYFSLPLIWSAAVHQYYAIDATTYLVTCIAAKLSAHFLVPSQDNLDITSILPPVD